ncbi:MAG: hypothetical protein JEZ06_15895 [Anaerolineaceae bacterium]|nr:hypothetical protein [Anaerolineaceae bacterium]
MENKHRLLIGFVMLALVSLACNLPWQQEAVSPLASTTPNMTMTTFFSQATMLTPDFSELATDTPEQKSQPSNTPMISQTPSSTLTATIEASLTPTETDIPTQTMTTTAYPVRSGGLFIAQYMNTPPVIDGDWGEWTSTTYSAGSVVWGADKWVNSDDLGATFRIGWDENNLYIAVKVSDDLYVQNSTGYNMWLGDHIELLLDTNREGDYYSSELTSDDYQIGLSPGYLSTNGLKEAMLWFPRAYMGVKSTVNIASSGGNGLYRLETAIPWNVLGITPSENTRFGFALSVSDNDKSGQNVQESMVSSSPYRKLINPTTWGELVLEK